LQSKIAKEIPSEQGNLDDLDPVLPGTALTPQREQVGDALGGELVTDYLLVP